MRMLRLRRDGDDSAHPGSIVLLTRLARLVYRRSTEELLGIRLKELMALAYLRDHEAGLAAGAQRGDAPGREQLRPAAERARGRRLRERQRDADRSPPSPRRAHARGRQALERAERAQERIEDDVLAALGPDERATLRDLLSRALEAPSQALADDEHVAVRVGDDAERGRAE